MNHRSEIFKVLCQPHSIDKYNPELKQDILWPCLRFPIALRAKGYQDLNLFESTMLRLIGEGENDIRQLSKKMGLINEKEEYSSIVHFLSAKLQQLNLITERFRLTEEGKQLLNKMNNAEPRTIAATVYFDLLNQCWLPMISRGEIKPIHVDKLESDLVQFTQGSTGKLKQIEAFLPLLPDQEQKKRQEYARKNLNERTVIDIIRRSRQKDKMLGGHNGNRDGYITEKGTISINSPEEDELVYLHCYVFKVSGYERFYVSDGFRSTIQDRFSQGFNNKCYVYKNLREELRRKSRKVHNRQVWGC